MSNTKSAVQKIYVFNHGAITRDSIIFLGSGAGVATVREPNPRRTLIEIPVASFLLVTRDGNILIDTGLNEIYSSSQASAIERDITICGSEYAMESNLKKVGLTIEDIHMVILTHLHYDHSGGLTLFAKNKIPFIVQKKELEVALSSIWQEYDGKHPLYLERDLPKGNNWYTITNSFYELTEEVSIHRVGGHTPGSQVVHVKSGEKGDYIFAGDFVHLPEEYESETTGFARLTTNYHEWRDSLKTLKLLTSSGVRAEKSKLVVSHDPDLFTKFHAAPKSII